MKHLRKRYINAAYLKVFRKQFNMKFLLVCMVYCVAYSAGCPGRARCHRRPPWMRNDSGAPDPSLLVSTVLSKFAKSILQLYPKDCSLLCSANV